MTRMTKAEAVILCRFAKACCPQQAFDEYTPDAWFELLNDLRFDQCKEAVVRVVKRQPFVSPSEIRTEVKRIRFDLIDKFGLFDPPPSISKYDDDWKLDTAYREWIADMNRRIGDGELTREQYDAEQAALGNATRRQLPPGFENTFRRADDDGDAA